MSAHGQARTHKYQQPHACLRGHPDGAPFASRPRLVATRRLALEASDGAAALLGGPFRSMRLRLTRPPPAGRWPLAWAFASCFANLLQSCAYAPPPPESHGQTRGSAPRVTRSDQHGSARTAARGGTCRWLRPSSTSNPRSHPYTLDPRPYARRRQGGALRAGICVGPGCVRCLPPPALLLIHSASVHYRYKRHTGHLKSDHLISPLSWPGPRRDLRPVQGLCTGHYGPRTTHIMTHTGHCSPLCCL